MAKYKNMEISWEKFRDDELNFKFAGKFSTLNG